MMGLQQPGAFTSSITSSSFTSFLFAFVASWLLLACCRIEFCLGHPPPAASVPSSRIQALLRSAPHAEIPPAVPPIAPSKVQDPHLRLPLAESSSSKVLLPQSSVSVSQASNPLPPVFKSSTPQFSVPQSHVSGSHSSSPSRPVSQSQSPQFFVSHPPSPQPPSSLLPTTHTSPPSRSPQAPKQPHRRPAARPSATHALRSGLVSGEESGENGNEEENAVTHHEGMEKRIGGKGGGRDTRRQDTGGWLRRHHGTRTRHPKPQLSPGAELRVGVVLPKAVIRRGQRR